MAPSGSIKMYLHLPEHLHERLRTLADRPLNPEGRFVLYWMHNALRGHENPALDVALVTGEQLGLPVFVYQGLSERYAYASDRHHAFILQGARDVHGELAARGIGSAIHVERPAHRGPHLRTLASRAALVVTEDLPTDPITSWVSRLSITVATPVWLIDTACVVPMKLVGRDYDRAFAYRDATRHLLDQRLTLPWPEQPNPNERFVPPGLPFDTVDLVTADLRGLIRECDIDHSVGPVPHTIGGSQAGYARGEEFTANKLHRYADDRNDALRVGASRMSAYLHYGMVSPLRIARESAEVHGPGAEKYLHELLVWRELAYAFCYYRPNHDSLPAIPNWAVNTLREHELDPRPALPDWETLARGRTGDRGRLRGPLPSGADAS
jgi:deoxyribodipyrimidine photolyase